MDNYTVTLKHINNVVVFIGIIVFIIRIPIYIAKKYIACIERNNCMKHCIKN